MFTRDTCAVLALILCCSSLVVSQTTGDAPPPVVTAAATAGRVRFAAPGDVVELRLEVFAPGGEKFFDSDFRRGNIIDWPAGAEGGQLFDGEYLCVVTTRGLSGNSSQQYGLLTFAAGRIALRAVARDQLAPAQSQAWELSRSAMPSLDPQKRESEGPRAFVVLGELGPTTTVTAHDGRDGQVASTTGALTFRLGDFFSGQDKEQMRLTEEGNLGIGTARPKAKLDVAGLIRAREGFMFSDGSTLKVNEKGVLTRTSANGPDSKSITATTQNQIAKFTDNFGTVGDSVMTESVSGFIGVGTTNPQSLLQVGPNTGYGSTTGLLVTNNLIGSPYDRAFQLAPRQTANPASNSILMYALPTVNSGVTVPTQYGVFVDGRQGPGAISSYAAVATGQTPGLGASNNTHLLLGNLAIPPGNYAVYDNTGFKNFFSGSVGIGTSAPATKLDVNGTVRFTPGGSGGDIVFGTPSAKTGMTISNASTRADLRFDGSQLELVAGAAGSAPPSANGITIKAVDTYPYSLRGYVGIGTTSPEWRLHVNGTMKAEGNLISENAIFSDSLAVDFDTLYVNSSTHRVGIGTQGPQATLDVVGTLRVRSLAAAAATHVCINASEVLSTCSSSLRYKDHVAGFGAGLDLVNRLRPVTFNWKGSGQPDVGLIAEEVNQVAPLLVTHNAQGQIEGVKYDQLSVVLINAVREQQTEIGRQREHIRRQQAEIEGLKTLVCRRHPRAAICK